MTLAPRGSCANSDALRMPRVSGVSGSRHTRISLAARNAGSCSAPWKLSTFGSDLGERLQPRTLKPNSTSFAAAAVPSSPRPMMPMVRSHGAG